MKKFILKVSVRKGFAEKDIEDVNINLQNFSESIRLRELDVFDKDAYLVFSLSEVEEKEADVE